MLSLTFTPTHSHFDPVMSDTASYISLFDVSVISQVMIMKHSIRDLHKCGDGSIPTVSSNGGGFPRVGFTGALGDVTLLVTIRINQFI